MTHIKTNADDFAQPTAFPEATIAQCGLTKREHFAAMAMQGFMSSKFCPHADADYITEYAVKCADSLIQELNKTP